MSRIGKKLIYTANLDIKIEDSHVIVKRDKMVAKIKLTDGIKADFEGNYLKITSLGDISQKFHGLTRTLVSNTIKGLTSSFSVNLDLVGVGYKVEKRENKLILSLGYSHSVEYELPEGVDCIIEKMQKPIQQYQTTLTIKGWNKEQVGQVAADLVALRKPDAYKGKGVRYADRPLLLKPGKSGTKSGKK